MSPALEWFVVELVQTSEAGPVAVRHQTVGLRVGFGFTTLLMPHSTACYVSSLSMCACVCVCICVYVHVCCHVAFLNHVVLQTWSKQ